MFKFANDVHVNIGISSKGYLVVLFIAFSVDMQESYLKITYI